MISTTAFAGLLSVLLTTAGSQEPPAGKVFRVGALVGSSPAPVEQVIEGFRDEFRRLGLGLDLVVHRLESGATPAWGGSVDLILALGSGAASLAEAGSFQVPVVTSLVMRPSELPHLTRSTGVYLEFPPEVEFQWLRRVLPEARRVGVLYSAQNEEWVGRAEGAARAAGLDLVALRVDRPADLPRALEAITRSAEVLLGVADLVVLTPETARTVLLASLRGRVPFVGMSGSWVRAGALYALDRDYQDVGRQCAEMAAALLTGQGAAARPAPPRKVLYAINTLTAERLRVALSPDILGKASEVIR